MADPRTNGARPPRPTKPVRPEPDPLDRAQAAIERARALKSAADCDDEITARAVPSALVKATAEAAAQAAERVAVRMASRPEIERPETLPTLPSARDQSAPESEGTKAKNKLKAALLTALATLATAAAAWLASRLGL
jgi:hypothetical protein